MADEPTPTEEYVDADDGERDMASFIASSSKFPLSVNNFQTLLDQEPKGEYVPWSLGEPSLGCLSSRPMAHCLRDEECMSVVEAPQLGHLGIICCRSAPMSMRLVEGPLGFVRGEVFGCH